jgi:hypothetical protein
LNCDPPELYLSSSKDYRCEPLVPVCKGTLLSEMPRVEVIFLWPSGLAGCALDPRLGDLRSSYGKLVVSQPGRAGDVGDICSCLGYFLVVAH